jgi:hypothetical protein
MARCSVVSRNLPSQAVIGRDALKVDPREFRWIGSSGTNTVVCYVRGESAIRKADDLFTRDLIVGGIGSGSTQSTVPTALNRLLNMRFKIVEGYKGNADALVALERAKSTVSAPGSARCGRRMLLCSKKAVSGCSYIRGRHRLPKRPALHHSTISRRTTSSGRC